MFDDLPDFCPPLVRNISSAFIRREPDVEEETESIAQMDLNEFSMPTGGADQNGSNIELSEMKMDPPEVKAEPPPLDPDFLNNLLVFHIQQAKLYQTLLELNVQVSIAKPIVSDEITQCS